MDMPPGKLKTRGISTKKERHIHEEVLFIAQNHSANRPAAGTQMTACIHRLHFKFLVTILGLLSSTCYNLYCPHEQKLCKFLQKYFRRTSEI